MLLSKEKENKAQEHLGSLEATYQQNGYKSLSQKSNCCKIKGLEESASKVRYVIENK